MTAEPIEPVNEQPVSPEAEPEWRLYELEDLRHKLRAELHGVSQAIGIIRARIRNHGRPHGVRPPKLDPNARGCSSCGRRPKVIYSEGDWRVIMDHRPSCNVLRTLP